MTSTPNVISGDHSRPLAGSYSCWPVTFKLKKRGIRQEWVGPDGSKTTNVETHREKQWYNVIIDKRHGATCHCQLQLTLEKHHVCTSCHHGHCYHNVQLQIMTQWFVNPESRLSCFLPNPHHRPQTAARRKRLLVNYILTVRGVWRACN